MTILDTVTGWAHRFRESSYHPVRPRMRILLASSVLLLLFRPGVGQAQLRSEGVGTVSGAPSDHFQPRRYHALLIGVQDYDDARLKLDHPVADADALRDVLVNNYMFDAKDVTVLRNPRRSTIFHVLDSLRYALNRSDNLLVFFAGHGSLDTVIDRGYWWPADASRDRSDAQISVLDIRDRIKAIQTQHTLVIADACFSGAMVLKTRSGDETTNLAGLAALDRDASRRVMTSGALTAVPDKSIFMKYLLLRLGENTQDALTANELYAKLQVEVPSNKGPTPQYNIIDDADHRGGEFIFVRRAPARVVAGGSDLDKKAPTPTAYDIPALKARFKEMRFFESDSVLAPMGKRVYSTRFVSGTTRFVGTEIELSYDAPPGRVVELQAACTYTRVADGSEVGVTRNVLRSEAAWKGIVWWVGLGSSSPGVWTAGSYSVKCDIGGKTFATGTFESSDRVTAPIRSINARVAGLRFWEQAFTDWQLADERHYETTFDKATARTIGVELEFRFEAPGKTSEIPISCTRYKADGTELGKQDGKFSPEPTWTGALWTPGPFGYENPGYYTPGTYRVECFAEGRMIAEGSFEVTSPVVIPAIEARLTGVKFWEEPKGKIAKEDRKYVSSFSSKEARYIGVMLEFDKPAGGRRINVQVSCTRYWPDGKVLGTQTDAFDPDPEWTSFTWTPTEGGLGWAEPGNYQPGEYRVECSIDGKVIAKSSFIVKRE